ncbi:RsfA family transcriptional regulator [Sediminibacillus halophilus]|uniref:Prespore-specific regulator n=1 Tax=Sediminibacillus halophilus TaxID=482461 RepID=A0A1G9XUC9_9BACI|nr:RsfA family transcriptional regulator [Sediminibacillus halophilus]SDM99843.1 prespore-specific regulator [Sediminibacillus halophilus]
MVKVRQDAWSHEDDLLLAETVLRHIREGSTQLNAFEEVGDKLNRTSAACGFRWNAEVRKKYEQAVDIAKRQRKEKKRALAKQQKTAHKPAPAFLSGPVEEVKETVNEQFHLPVQVAEDESSINLDTVIDYLASLKQGYHDSRKSQLDVKTLTDDNESLKEENHRLKKQLGDTKEQLQAIQEDYQVLIQIMDRARKMVVFDDQESLSASAFKMDKNGNLEHMAR